MKQFYFFCIFILTFNLFAQDPIYVDDFDNEELLSAKFVEQRSKKK